MKANPAAAGSPATDQVEQDYTTIDCLAHYVARHLEDGLMTQPVTLTLSGRIYLDAETGQYVSVIEGWDISACAPTMEEVVERTWKLVDGHLEVAQQLGVLERELARIGATLPTGKLDRIIVRARLAVEGEHQVVLLAS